MPTATDVLNNIPTASQLFNELIALLPQLLSEEDIDNAEQQENRFVVLMRALRDCLGPRSVEQIKPIVDKHSNVASSRSNFVRGMLAINGCADLSSLKEVRDRQGRIFFQAASDASHVNATGMLAFMIQHGRGGDQNKDKVTSLYERDGENIFAKEYKLRVLETAAKKDSGKKQQVFELCLSVVQGGNCSNEMICQLGWMYNRGYGVEQDKAQAKQYYEQAASLGEPWGVQLLADWYLNNNQPEQAIDLYLHLLEFGVAAYVQCYKALHNLVKSAANHGQLFTHPGLVELLSENEPLPRGAAKDLGYYLVEAYFEPLAKGQTFTNESLMKLFDPNFGLRPDCRFIIARHTAHVKKQIKNQINAALDKGIELPQELFPGVLLSPISNLDEKIKFLEEKVLCGGDTAATAVHRYLNTHRDNIRQQGKHATGTIRSFQERLEKLKKERQKSPVQERQKSPVQRTYTVAYSSSSSSLDRKGSSPGPAPAPERTQTELGSCGL